MAGFSGFLLPAVLFALFTVTAAKRDQALTLMEKMMTVMALSMLVGLLTGLFAGGLFHENFAAGLLYGVSGGTLLGVLLGLPFKGIAVAEGAFTGGMAGMMGAMTAVMLLPAALTAAVLISLLLFSGACLWSCLLMMSRAPEGEPSENRKKASPGFTLPWLTVCCVYLLLVFTFFLLSPPVFQTEPGGGPSGHEHSYVPVSPADASPWSQA
ncbi:hypothetical protein CR205_18360 [Alteribacter lacisalsi]|uniref:Uncharacterized protein n=1 Tax=Alteribacter lacisalsi TaxID=2045244 RepID=A0A2W0H2R5_9BACI|nr:hypothetical protein [Alteribacter lacisalsi]PYZ95497.1 hypothetical protein CR205_18360 [Alteribacter lacisalsi]